MNDYPCAAPRAMTVAQWQSGPAAVLRQGLPPRCLGSCHNQRREVCSQKATRSRCCSATPPPQERKLFDEKFVRTNTERLCELTSRADSLQLKPLVDLTSRALARIIEERHLRKSDIQVQQEEKMKIFG